MAEERLFVSLKAYLGDAVMAMPLLEELQGIASSMTLSTAPFVRPVVWRPGFEYEFVPMIKERAPWSVIRHARALRRHRFTTAVLVNRAFRAAVIARLAGIPRRIGHASEGRDGLLTDVVPFDESKFEAYCSLDLLIPLGKSVEPRRPRLAISAEERTRGAELLSGATIAFQPGARFPLKQLPFEVIRDVAAQLQGDGHRLVLLGGPEERGDAQRLAEALSQPVVDLVGKTSLRETIGVLSQATVAVGADTGVMHLAAGAGCPTVTIFGPTPAVKWGHDYAPHRVLRAEEGKMENVKTGEILASVRGVFAAR